MQSIEKNLHCIDLYNQKTRSDTMPAAKKMPYEDMAYNNRYATQMICAFYTVFAAVVRPDIRKCSKTIVIFE